MVMLPAGLLVPSPSVAQQLITPEDAVRAGLQNNFGILTAQNEAAIHRLNHTFGNAGLLPVIGVTGTRLGVVESEADWIDGSSRVFEDLESTSMSLGMELDWTLFTGLERFATYRKLGELQNLGETLSTVQIENTVTDIYTAYYDLVRQKKLLEVLNSKVGISEERYYIARAKRDFGSGSEYELLLAQTDLNADRSEIIRHEVVVNDARLELTRLLDLNSDLDFNVVMEIMPDRRLDFDALHRSFQAENSMIRAAAIRTSIAEYEIREARRIRLPAIDLNLGYAISRNELLDSQVLIQQAQGMYLGVTARFNIFDGFNTHRRIQSAQLSQKNETIRLREQQKNLETQLLSEFKNYSNTIRLIDLENENLKLAEMALEIALEQFRLGTITSIELRETQRILFDTENRLINTRFVAKVSETELLRLSGRLNLQI